MGDFKNELKRKSDVEFSRIKSKYRSKVDKKRTLQSAANNLELYGKVIKETTDRITVVANKLYPEMEVPKETAIKEIQGLIRKYMVDIKKLTGF